ncbi:DUF6049 family protein [Actinokineospora sp. PR83]|uniref:DUF6049 family protein n=1 Tax=Actinokineospora sp. PR83 TaxID=2884908 RepID=UPI0027E1B088|nr:DUF6049 family protein [Actinokineospora sp. PR83]MCG8917977.1 DUF6049 family protein [Actinokineospora sp. PR83]
MTDRLRRTGLVVLAAVLAALVVPLPSAAAQQPGRLRVDLDQLLPRVVDAAAQAITVTGKITNTGDRNVEKIEARLQRGAVLDTESALRGALNDPQKTDAVNRPQVSSTFQPISDRLDPGESASFSISVPLGADKGALKLDRPGVYPVALNFNGDPEFGRTERVGALSTLLPVLSVPGGGAVTPPAAPSRLTVLWPLVDDRPRRVQTPLDGTPPVFSDDGLSSSVSGGRLFNLVDAVQRAARSNASMLRSLCFAVDPDLLESVQVMTTGYRVRTADGRLVDGSGGRAAQLWLDRVKELTRGQCVVALPYADADLAALSRAGATGLQANALDVAVQVETALGTKPLAGVVWPESGTLDARTLGDLAKLRRTTVLVDSGKLRDTSGAAPHRLADNLNAVPYDQLIANSLSPRTTGDDSGVKTSSVQNGLATLVFRAAFQAVPGQVELVAPPRRWNASGAELTVFLQAIESLEAQGYLDTLGLQSLVDGTEQGQAAGVDYSAADTAAELPSSAVATVAQVDAMQRELTSTVLFEDDTQLVQPDALVQPLRAGLIRASSAAWRSTPERAGAATDEVSNQMSALLSQVTVTDPGRPLSLASADSPIPVYITNWLPVKVQARINLGSTPGLKPEQQIVVQIPAKASLPRYLPAEVTRSGRFSVDIWLTTEQGTRLGGTSRVELNSTSYGSITLAVTFLAAGVLVLLVGLRLFRRIRARRTAGTAVTDQL